MRSNLRAAVVAGACALAISQGAAKADTIFDVSARIVVAALSAFGGGVI